MNFLVWGIYDLFENGLLRMLLGKLNPDESGRAALIGGCFVLCMVVSYLLGSVNWALVISRVFYHDDIRKYGSGNAGATNMLRTYGMKAAVGAFLGDGLKGVASVLFACLIFGHPNTEAYYIYLITAVYLSAFFAILGHVFPCFARFHGGKGVATTALTVLALDPAIFLILLVVFVVLVAGTRYVSLGSVTVVCFYPVLLASFDKAFTRYGVHTLIVMMIAALIVWAHRANLSRIRQGTENKISFSKKAPVSAPTKNTSEDDDA
ncbi:MAG: glycerol-3-phosphate 1-O-acyltransferase PlsY [Clostridia bacterium]|nr:glycerol-3-phosphate 1-O-acyltransferase PlsY [Clostridia bacterium]